MNIRDEHVNAIRSHLNQLVGNITTRNLFTGYGLFHQEETMFGIWINKNLYLRAKDGLAEKLLKLGCEPFTTDQVNKRFVLSHYYALSNKVLADNNLCRTLVILSIQQIRDQKLKVALGKMNRLKDLPNLTIKHERALMKVGISDVAALKEVGAENTIVRLKKAGITATLDFYWKLVGALRNKNCQMLGEKEKAFAAKKLNEVLHTHGFRGYRKFKNE